jgi:Ni/Fe-hydrogenase subunit HybB-like protein
MGIYRITASPKGLGQKALSMARRGSNIIFDEMERSPKFYVWLSILAASILLAGYALVASIFFSMEILEFYTNIPWVMMVSNYVFLVGSSVGLTLVVSLGLVFGLRRYEMIAKRGLFVALIAIICGLTSIGLHLGHPERGAIYNVLTPNFRSAMWWMGTLYPPYILFVAMGYWLLARAELVRKARASEGLKAKVYGLMALEGLKGFLYQRFPLQRWESGIYRRLPLERLGLSLNSEGVEWRWARIFVTLALIFGLMGYSVEGGLFAHVEARPFWYGPLYPIDFFIGASFCGLAWLMVLSIITYRVLGEEIPSELRKLLCEMAEILAVLLSAGFLFTVYKMGHGLFEPAKADIIMLFLKGPFSMAFWAFEIGVGIVLPVLILLYAAGRKKTTGILVASLMVLVGYFVKRYDFVVASQVYPLIKRQYPLSSHTPTIMEVFLISGIIGALLLAYTLGVRFLPLKAERGVPSAPPG